MENKYIVLLKSLESYHEFTEKYLPSKINLNKIYKVFDFILPCIIILHGSCVTGKRRSPNSEKDIDLILVNEKFVFWNYEKILDTANIKSEKNRIPNKFDVSITTFQGLLNHLKNKTSLGISLKQGFSIIPLEVRK